MAEHFWHSHFEYEIPIRSPISLSSPLMAEVPRGLKRTIGYLKPISKQPHTHSPFQKLVTFTVSPPGWKLNDYSGRRLILDNFGSCESGTDVERREESWQRPALHFRQWSMHEKRVLRTDLRQLPNLSMKKKSNLGLKKLLDSFWDGPAFTLCMGIWY